MEMRRYDSEPDPEDLQLYLKKLAEAVHRINEMARQAKADLAAVRRRHDRMTIRYFQSGCPFGVSDEAIDIWCEYRQRTTLN